jgi:hypothetical protein
MGESRLSAELKVQSKRFSRGVLLCMVGFPLLIVSPLPPTMVRVIIIGSCAVLVGIWLRFFYILFFKKDE